MNQDKLYILAFKANFHWKKLFSISFYTQEIGKWIIRLFTWSKIHHLADSYSYADCNKLINQAVVPNGYESIHYMECIKNRDSHIYAYEIKAPIDFDLWHKNTVEKRGSGYDYKGAVDTTFRIFGTRVNDIEESCSETPTWKLMQQGYLGSVKNENTINPKELLRLLNDYGLCDPKPILVWNGKKLINNIFE